ncbi:MAG: hypothetical protein ACI8WB_000210 [Phenylobacterium sp.]|jgi:hypothetical protein
MMNQTIKRIVLMLVALTFSSALQAQSKLSITDYVSQTFIHGMPYNEAMQYEQSEVATLKAMLSDHQQHQHWPNIVVMLEIIGDKHIVDDIITFIEEDRTGDFGNSFYRAKTAALYGLGYVINHHNSKKALKYLQSSLAPDVWQQRGLVGKASYQKDAITRNNDMSKYAMLGLALSGTQSAQNILTNLKVTKLKQPGFQRQVSAIIDNAIVENEKIKTAGLSEYYSQQDQVK